MDVETDENGIASGVCIELYPGSLGGTHVHLHYSFPSSIIPLGIYCCMSKRNEISKLEAAIMETLPDLWYDQMLRRGYKPIQAYNAHYNHPGLRKKMLPVEKKGVLGADGSLDNPTT